MDQLFDYAVVGSGAGGAAAAWRLARSGASVVVLEKGGRLPGDGSTLDVGAVMREGRFKSAEAWQDGKGRRVVPGEFFNLGGKTKWYGAALLRFAHHEFAPDAAHMCLGWPFGLDELAPYYDQAERALAVRRFEIEPDLRAIVGRVTAADGGWSPEPLPLGLSADILADEREARHFDGFASVRALKSDAEIRFLAELDGSGRCRVVTESEVVALDSAPGRPDAITAAVCADGRRVRARTVLLAAGALHTPRLVERYLRNRWPDHRQPGLELVGRNYKCHVNTALLALSRRPQTDLLRKTAILFHARFPHSSVQTLGWMDGEIVGAQLPSLVPAAVANALGRRAYGFWLTTEDGSHADNRVSAGAPDGPARLDYDTRRLPATRLEHGRLVNAFRAALWRAGLPSFPRRMPLEVTGHACGTMVAGGDPARSVVDGEGRVRGFANLYVVDGSALPRSSRVNPSLSIYAWALRVADRLAKAAGAGAHARADVAGGVA